MIVYSKIECKGLTLYTTVNFPQGRKVSENASHLKCSYPRRKNERELIKRELRQNKGNIKKRTTNFARFSISGTWIEPERSFIPYIYLFLFQSILFYFSWQIDTSQSTRFARIKSRRPPIFLSFFSWFGCLVTCGYLWSLARIRRGCFSDQVSEL